MILYKTRVRLIRTLVLISLLQVILKILSYSLVQVHALMPHHVVSLARVSEEVGLGTSLDALLDEHKTVLRYYGRIIVSCDNL